MAEEELVVTESELLEALRKAMEAAGGEEAGGALTVKQLQKELDWTQYKVYAGLDELDDLIECVWVKMMDRARRMSKRPAYRLKPPSVENAEQDEPDAGA